MSDPDSFEEKPAIHRCADCGIDSPRTETNYTLISSRHGWRLALRVGADGRRETEWRCPNCWEAFKGRK